MGEDVCKRGLIRLLGVGKHRFQRLYNAAVEGREDAPLDGRYIPKGPQDMSDKKTKVYDFLHGLYKSAAECLPDGNHRASSRRPRQGSHKHDDKDMDLSRVRHLPPGKIMDYLRLCRAELPDVKVSAKLFNCVPGSDLLVATVFDLPRSGWNTLLRSSEYGVPRITASAVYVYDTAS